MVAEYDLYKKQQRDMLGGLFQRVNNSVYGGNIRKDINDQYKFVTENFVKEKYDDRVKEGWPMKNGNVKVKLEDDAAVDDKDLAESNNQMPCHLAGYVLRNSKPSLNNVIRDKDGFYSNKIYYGDADSAFFLKKTLVYFR